MNTTPPDKMKPMLILPPDTMTPEDMVALRENGICVVVAKDPLSIKFVDPLPSCGSRTKMEEAAIQLSRKVLNPGYWSGESTRQQMTALYVDLLINGTALSKEPTEEEHERLMARNAKWDEIRRLAREEARAERAAEKAKSKKLLPATVKTP